MGGESPLPAEPKLRVCFSFCHSLQESASALPYPHPLPLRSAATIKPVPLQLSTPVKFVKRIGDRIAAGLADRGILTIEDLLYHLPFRYEDRLHPKPLSLYNPGDMASLIGEVRGTALLRTRSGPIFEMTVGITPPAPAAPTQTLSSRPESASFADGVERPLYSARANEISMEGLLHPPPPLLLETVKCMWFHGTYLKDKFKPGQKIALYGKLEGSRSGNALHAPPGSTRFKMIQPTFEILPDNNATGEDAEFILLEMGRIVPVYESLGGKTPLGQQTNLPLDPPHPLDHLQRPSRIRSPPQNSVISTRAPAANSVISTGAERSGETPVFRRDRQRIYGCPVFADGFIVG